MGRWAVCFALHQADCWTQGVFKCDRWQSKALPVIGRCATLPGRVLAATLPGRVLAARGSVVCCACYPVDSKVWLRLWQSNPYLVQVRRVKFLTSAKSPMTALLLLLTVAAKP